MRDKKKKSIKVRDLKPKKDAKGGYFRMGAGKNPDNSGHQITGPTSQK